MTQISKRAVPLTALLAFTAMLAVPVAAQTTASIDALATVQNGFAPITATGVHDLDFGTVDAGLGPYASPEAGFGRFNLTGEASASVLVEYTTLPTVLANVMDPSETIPIYFNSTDFILWPSGYPGSYTGLNPLISQTLAFDGLGNLVVGISGTIDPPLTAVDGDYAGTIVLTVAYP
jgi:hypothetical protein